MIDERFRRMLMMDLMQVVKQNKVKTIVGFFGSNLTGGLLSNLNPSLIIGKI